MNGEVKFLDTRYRDNKLETALLSSQGQGCSIFLFNNDFFSDLNNLFVHYFQFTEIKHILSAVWNKIKLNTVTSVINCQFGILLPVLDLTHFSYFWNVIGLVLLISQ